MVSVGAKGARRTLIAMRTFRDLADRSSRAVGNPKFGVGDSFPHSPAKASRPSRIESWPRESGQVDKWIFCLTTATLAEDQEIR
jgi:hypothetical protein